MSRNQTFLCPPMEGTEYDALLINPDRGFRTELYFTPGPARRAPHNQESNGFEEMDRDLALFEGERCHLAQVYFYLCEFDRRDISSEAFCQMKQYLQMLRERGIRAVLRFAYEYDVDRKQGPATKWILRHCEQIGQWFRENESFIYSTVSVLQAGMVGAWGEWHNAKYPHSGKKVLEAICRMALPDMGVQVRTFPIRKKARHSR